MPHALSEAEIAAIVDQYAAAAKLALEAGFDGIELHGANGYLIDQFLRDASNQRDDRYGGTARRRAQLLLDVIAALRVTGTEIALACACHPPTISRA